MPIVVFNYKKEGYIERAVRGDRVGTLVSSESVDEKLNALISDVLRLRGRVLVIDKAVKIG